ncbi:MAG: fumarylacetoacetate hydrolase family protein, partial [Candidatus Marinimicrobia bacterium]|nr:fumarylacetoacetate hydrolase family protein [Candidatus Neomarinimicrobiota bacterium]
MKLISYKKNGNIKLGAFEEGKIYDLHALDGHIADNMLEFLQGGEGQLQLAMVAMEDGSLTISAEDVELISPVPNPPSVR